MGHGRESPETTFLNILLVCHGTTPGSMFFSIFLDFAKTSPKGGHDQHKVVAQDLLFVLTCLEHASTPVDTELYATLTPRVAAVFDGKSEAEADKEGVNGGWMV